MASIAELLARAAALRDETALNSISPERAGGIMYDTLVAMNELWLQQGAALVISKIYASVEAMEADTAPVSDLTGQALRPGQIVVIASSDEDNGSVYRYDGPADPSWSAVGNIGAVPVVDDLTSDSSILALAARQGKVLDGKFSQLDQEVNYFVAGDIFNQEGFYIASGASAGNFSQNNSWRTTHKIPLQGKDITGYFYLPSTAANGAAIFFDENGAFVSAYYISGGTIGNNTIPASAFPQNAKYIAISTLASNVQNSYVSYGVPICYVLDSILKDELSASILDLSKVTVRFKNYGKELFLKDGYYDARTGVFISSNSVKTTPILQINGEIRTKVYLGGSAYLMYGFCFYDEDGEFISGYTGTTAGLQEVVFNPDNLPSGAKFFAVSTLNSYLNDAYLNCGIDAELLKDIESLKQIITPITEKISEIDDRLDSIDEQLEYSNGVAGLVFDNSEEHQLAKSAIKAVWLTYGPYVSSDAQREIVDSLRESLTNSKLYITYLYNVNGTYGCFLRIDDAASGGTNCFSKFVAGIHTITGDEEVWDMQSNSGTIVWPSDSGLSAAPFSIHFAIDWNTLNNKTVTSAGSHPIQINFGELNWGERVFTKTLRDEVESLAEQETPLLNIAGKTIVCFGDSLTEMVDTTNGKHYSDYIADFTSAHVVNVGIGGSQIRKRAPYNIGVFDSSKSYAIDDYCIYTNGSNETRLYKFTSAHTGAWDDNDVELAQYQSIAYSNLDIYSLVKASCEQSFEDVIAACKVVKETQSDDNTAIIERLIAIDWSKVDAITIFAGTNDWYGANSLGETGSNNTNKTLGAINEIIRLFLTAYPQIKVFWFTPIVRWVSDFNVSTNPPTIDDTKFSDNYSVEGNGTLKEECAAIIQEVSKNHIPICDMYNNFGWNKYNCKLYFVGTDGTHPRTYAGVTYLAKKIGAFILANNTL